MVVSRIKRVPSGLIRNLSPLMIGLPDVSLYHEMSGVGREFGEEHSNTAICPSGITNVCDCTDSTKTDARIIFSENIGGKNVCVTQTFIHYYVFIYLHFVDKH